jgi:hypothetical protein
MEGASELGRVARPGENGTPDPPTARKLSDRCRERWKWVPEAARHSMSPYVDHTGEPEVDHRGEPLPNWVYARVPSEVVCDGGLKLLDIQDLWARG